MYTTKKTIQTLHFTSRSGVKFTSNVIGSKEIDIWKLISAHHVVYPDEMKLGTHIKFVRELIQVFALSEAKAFVEDAYDRDLVEPVDLYGQ